MYLRADLPLAGIAHTAAHEACHAVQFTQWGPVRGDWDRAQREQAARAFGDRIARAADGAVVSLA